MGRAIAVSLRSGVVKQGEQKEELGLVAELANAREEGFERETNGGFLGSERNMLKRLFAALGGTSHLPLERIRKRSFRASCGFLGSLELACRERG